MDVESSLPSVAAMETRPISTATLREDGMPPSPTLLPPPQAKESSDWSTGFTQSPDPSSKTTTPISRSVSPEGSGQLSLELQFLKEAHDHLGKYERTQYTSCRIFLKQYRILQILHNLKAVAEQRNS